MTPQRQFSVLDGVGNVVGGAVKTTGDIMNSGVGGTAGAIGGAYLGSRLMLNTAKAAYGSGKLGLGLLAHGGLGMTAGVLGGAILGAKLVKGIGKTLHNTGNSLGA